MTVRATAAAVAFVSFLVYVATLYPSVNFGDWAEMQAIPYQLGIAHPTGYPLAVLLGKAWSLLPIGSVAYRANLLSAVEVSTALGVAVLLMARLGVRPLVAAAFAVLVAAVPTTWEAGTTARVDALHFLLVTLVVHRALVWAQDRRPRDLVLVALFTGLALANHLLTLTVAPFVALYVVWVGRRELVARPVLVAAAAASGAVGLGLYAYIPIRAAFGPSWAYGGLLTVDGFWALVSGAMFRTDMKFLSTAGVGNFVAHAGDVLRVVEGRWHPVFLVAAVLGLGAIARRDRAFGVLAVALVGANLYYFVNYRGDLEHYLLLTWLLIATGAAVAFQRALEWLVRAVEAGVRTRRLPRRLAAVPVAELGTGVLVALAVLAIGLGWRANDRSGDGRGDAFVDRVFAALPPNAAILTYWDAIQPMWYAHCIEGERPDLLILTFPATDAQGCQDFHGDIRPLVGRRPTFALLPFEADYTRLAAAYDLTTVDSLVVPYGRPYPEWTRPLVRLQAPS